jgi:aminoglycoside phosphotransferase (APT) family kinase protein
MNSSENRLPRTVDELTPAWLTRVLAPRCPGLNVVSARIDNILWGTATKVLIECEYEGAPDVERPPRKLCIKGELDERVRKALATITTTGTQIEACFYNQLAPLVQVELPRHWYAGSEPGMGILILDDLTGTGTRFGTPTEPWRPALVGRALDVLARLHATTWDRDLSGIDWLKVGSPAVRQAHTYLMSEAHWRSFRAEPDAFQLPASLLDRERCLRAFHALWDHDDRVAKCVVHGDAHLGNTCIDSSERPYFIDWAGPCKSSWAFDVSYFIVGSLTVSDRRASETDLLRLYLERLAMHGGPKLDLSEAWLDYRRHHLPGLIWATVPSTMQPTANVQAMGQRYTEAILDHDTLHALGQ